MSGPDFTFCVDFDDYCDATIDELKYLDKLRSRHDGFKCTLYTIPKRTSEKAIKQAKRRPWIQLAPHGWRHTRGECLSWTDDEAEYKIRAARDMGIDAPVFRAPAWLIDADTYKACDRLNYVVSSHMLFRVPGTGVREYIYNRPDKMSPKCISAHGHMTNVAGNYIKDLIKNNELEFPHGAKFGYPQDFAAIIDKSFVDEVEEKEPATILGRGR